MLNESPIEIPWGIFYVQWSKRGLTSLRFPSRQRPTRRGMQRSSRLVKLLVNYINGNKIKIDIPLDLTEGTVFQRRVWKQICAIPYGKTRSYKWLANMLGCPSAVRAVANACGANKIPIIVPCHRVIASDGSIGGYSPGVRWKKRLLRLEK